MPMICLHRSRPLSRRLARFIFGATLACALAGTAHAGQASAALDRFVKEVHTLRASFEQQVLDASQRPLESARGTFLLKRPGRFAWLYQEPYAQTIVADGRNLWFYDVDLDQVSVRPQSEALGQTPAMLLSGSGDVERSFAVSDAGTQGGLAWVELKPRTQEGNFEQIRIGFADGDLRRMEMVDALGQKTELSFSQIERNPSLADKLFEFQVPEGVDVVGQPAPSEKP